MARIRYKCKKMTYLTKVDGEVDFVVLHTSGQGWTLPPRFGAVHCVLCGVPLLWVRGVAEVTNLWGQETAISWGGKVDSGTD